MDASSGGAGLLFLGGTGGGVRGSSSSVEGARGLPLGGGGGGAEGGGPRLARRSVGTSGLVSSGDEISSESWNKKGWLLMAWCKKTVVTPVQ